MSTVDTSGIGVTLVLAMNVVQQTVRGDKRWCVDGKLNGKRKRYYETLILKAKYQTLIGELIPVTVVEKLITEIALVP